MLAKLKKIFLGEDNTPSAVPPAGPVISMTRGEFIELIVDNFRNELKRQTTKRGLLFPTSFTVLMNQEDYAEQSEAFPMSVQEIIQGFNEVVSEFLPRYPAYKPHAYNWFLHFICIGDDVELPEDMGVAVPGRADPVVLMKLYSQDPSVPASAEGAGRQVTTVRTKNSQITLPNGLNMAAFPGVVTINKDQFRIPIVNFSSVGRTGSDVSANTHQINANPTTAPIGPRLKAVLGHMLAADGTEIRSFRMQPSGVEIHGQSAPPRATAEGRAVRVNVPDLLSPHAVIKLENNGRYSITAYGPIRLNERLYEPDPSKRYELYNNSTIMLGDSVQLIFTVK
ncbi:MAG: hypothetical protein K2M79_04745 [Muribaculaceae bacterium]|nr:hypothetical protein [Muribaculaceae bacterium]